ncbi:MAG: AbrB/MazE/SpoVT family DNA-binding domain-containing protein [Clostridia bacterium]|nr:AbrB/MazE/SpoVT family DNA-binding domain-containing protein [Clostridia bacterium]
MKATGIVRRIDELGRVVIPKEIRRTLRIREGDPLELFTDRDELMLKKYSPIASVERFAEGTAKSLNEQSGYLAAISDNDVILAAYGTGKKGLVGKTVSEKLTEILTSRRSYLASKAESGDVFPITAEDESAFTAQIIVPIVASGDCLGAVILLSNEAGCVMEGPAVKLARLTADIIANQFE